MMSLKERVESLREKHSALEQLLQDEIQRPLPSNEEISRIKKEKLKIKDEIARLSADGVASEAEATVH